MLDTIPYIPLFQNLPLDQVAVLKPLFEDFTCPANTVIFEQGDPASYMYLLISGEIAIRYKPYDGPAITLTRLRAGDVFGWSAVVGSKQYTSSIVSETEVRTIRIHGRDLVSLVENYPQTGEVIVDRLAQMVSSRWKNAYTQVQSLLHHAGS
ncbi:MAG: cyclic nucleotide-binding domain-containing protein [Anaerolineales bacterium]|nr:cyclic nucleotide-binding domain-containing protein [Anaerolineales bacterium]MBP6210985.1 cyclic nucleotide-binding domain-containing protein [Anaerolineales bacterium]